jgi:hypothetical protein
MKKLLGVLFLVAVFAAACKNNGPEKEAAADKSSAVCIWDKASLQDKPEKAGKWLSSISLGEKLTYLKEEKEEAAGKKTVKYYKVKLADGKEGWVRADFVAIGANVGVIFDKTDIYSRPDLATVTKNYFEPMDIVAVKSTQDGWTEVVGKRSAGKWIETAWIKNKGLSFEEKSVAAALYTRRALAKPNKQEQIAELRKITEISDLQGSLFEDYIIETIHQMEGASMSNMGGIDGEDDNVPDSAE